MAFTEQEIRTLNSCGPLLSSVIVDIGTKGVWSNVEV